MIVNQDAYQALPADLQHIVALAARTVNQDMLDEYTSRNNRALQQIKRNEEIEIRRLPSDVLAKLREVANTIYKENAAANPDFARVYEAYQQYMQQAQEYHAISEEAYYELRSAE